MSADPPSPPSPWRTHGGLSDADRERAGLGDAPVLDFSVNVNPYGPTEAMVQAIRDAPLDAYPDDTARAARVALGARWNTPPDTIVLGNGAAELLWLLARVLVLPGQRALVVGPTFSEFAAAVAATPGCEVHEYRALAADDFRVDLDVLSATIARLDPRAVYLCSPNNPTGGYLPQNQIAQLARQHPATTLVVDQSFLSLSEHPSDANAARSANVVWVRSLTKDHAIPGLRVGAAMMHPALAARLEATRPSWTTSAPVQAAAVAAARERSFIADSRARLIADRRALHDELTAAGLICLPSSTIFLLVQAPGATALTATLLRQHHILVRDCTSFGLPDHIRVAARPDADRRALLAALAVTWRTPGTAA